MPTPVTLHIYDVGDQQAVSQVNKFLKPVGTGAFHGAVEVYGKEWSYGFTDEGTGVFDCPPKGCLAHTYRESVPMGQTQLSAEEVEALLDELAVKWPGSEYDLLRRNCCTFSDELCSQLGVGNIPRWVTNLAGAGATLQDGFHTVHSTAQSAAIIAAAKANEIDSKYQIRSTTEAKVKDIAKLSADLDAKYGISDGYKKAITRAHSQFKELDDKHGISQKSQQAAVQAVSAAQSAASQVGAFFSKLAQPPANEAKRQSK
jgi:hypothetical protein